MTRHWRGTEMRYATTKWTLLSALSLSLSLTACGGEDSIAGRNCATDTECGDNGHCVGSPDGVCSVPASGTCVDGSRAECPGGSRCWVTKGNEYYCFADCNATCEGNGGCDSEGSCVPLSSLSTGPSSGGGRTGTSCSCSCTCDYCTGHTTATCGSASTACGSCSVVCADMCSTSDCGSRSSTASLARSAIAVCDSLPGL